MAPEPIPPLEAIVLTTADFRYGLLLLLLLLLLLPRLSPLPSKHWISTLHLGDWMNFMGLCVTAVGLPSKTNGQVSRLHTCTAPSLSAAVQAPCSHASNKCKDIAKLVIVKYGTFLLVCRYLLRDAMASMLRAKWKKWDILDTAIEREGWKLLLLLRLSPMVPYNLLNIAMATTKMHFLTFSVVTLFGTPPLPPLPPTRST